MKEIRTNTSALRFVGVGTYETQLGAWLDRVPDALREEAFGKVCELSADIINEHIWYANADEHLGVTFIGYWRPRYYNYETDVACLVLSYEPGYVWESLEGWEDDFADFLEKNYTSRDGFISFVPNNVPEWEKKFEENDEAAVGAWMRWWLNNRTWRVKYDAELEFLDKTYELLSENYDMEDED